LISFFFLQKIHCSSWAVNKEGGDQRKIILKYKKQNKTKIKKTKIKKTKIKKTKIKKTKTKIKTK